MKKMVISAGDRSAYAATVLGSRLAALRTAAEPRDDGASAIELAIITALIAVAAAAVAGVIVAVINSKSGIIQGL
jgi:ABC-type sulfate transport system permease subunit